MSGFSYPTWKPAFYPKGTKQSDMLAFYSTRFDAVEINMTFRRRIDEQTLDRWRDATPDGFRFTMKANAGITHFFRLKNTDERVREFVERAQRLASRLGVVFFQTPPNLKFEPEVLDHFCTTLVPGVDYAFEPRHESFNTPACDEILRRHGVARCCNDEVHDVEGYVPTAPFAYFRFHREKPYTKKELKRRAEIVGRTDAYVFFRHTEDPACVKPALDFAELTAAS
jgi:uncharacterized protein YecE (DUF72 family)